MNVDLYLGDITQEEINIGAFQKHYNPSLTVCCDGFCCILDFSKGLRPEDLVGNPVDKLIPRLSVGVERSHLDWLIRKEEFGGLLWNLHTGHVLQLDHEAYAVLRDLAQGKTLNQLAKAHDIEVTEIHQLLAAVTRKYETPQKVH
jgi:hypothetical protein